MGVTVRELATGINPAILRWAREQSGYTLDLVAQRMGKSTDQIAEWEDGAAHPTWRQFERLARDLYRRPTALFFFPDPPDEPPAITEFRRQPADVLGGLEPDTLYAVRLARARRLDLEELAQYADSGDKDIVATLGGKAHSGDAVSLASEARAYIGVSLDEQVAWSSVEVALDQWRDAIQDCGVWVFKRSFKQEDIAGFSLSSPKHPLIYLNNGQAKTRQIFTLFHELAHLLFGSGHLGRTDPEHYVELLHGEDRAIETACNAFAGEFLVPDQDFRRHAPPGLPNEETVASLAARYSVSREVILLDYRQRQWIDEQIYNEKLAELRANYSKGSGSGGNYYATQGTYLGAKYVTLALNGYYQGHYGQEQLSEYLGVKASSISGLENWLDSRELASQ